MACRTREIGVRVALGASRYDVTRMVLADATRVALAGTVIALAFAQIAGRTMRSLLFQVQPADPLASAAVAAVLIVTALAAGYIPARRTTRVDPVVALHNEYGCDGLAQIRRPSGCHLRGTCRESTPL